MPRPALRPPPPRRRAPTSRQTPVPDAARVPKRASARRATCRGPPVPTPRAPRSAPMPRNLSFLATEPRSGAKTVGAFATIRRRPGVSLAKASTSVEIGGKTPPARARTRFRGQKSPLLLHGRSKRKEPASGVRLSAISPNLIFHGDGLLAPGMQVESFASAPQGEREVCVVSWPRCFAAPGQPWKGVPPMDAQTVIALCAVFSVVLGMIGLSRRK